MNASISILIYAFFTSLLINILLISVAKRKNLFIDDINKSHGSHKIPTPRIGGIGIFISFFFSILFLSFEESYKLLISALPVFLIGLWEDFKGNINPRIRMIFMSIGAILSIFTLDVLVENISITTLPIFLAVPFTVFALVGITNAVNMIDGYNGLASGITIISLIFMAYLSYKLGDIELTKLMLVLAVAALGFLVINFPYGKIFLGDGGAYTLGFLSGVISLILLKRHPEVSPWFPVILFAYPVFDVLFAIFRRKFIQKVSPFSPDKLHFHSLIFKNVTQNNPLTSVFIIFYSLPFSVISLNFYNSDLYLSIIFLVFCSSYIFIYFYLFNKEKNSTLKGFNGLMSLKK